MNLSEERYAKYALCREMLETAAIVARFDSASLSGIGAEVAAAGRLLMTGEGSSRIFPAKSIMAHSHRCGWNIGLATEAGRQASEYDLSAWAVFALSNSGKTAEVIRLFKKLEAEADPPPFKLHSTHVAISCGGYFGCLKCGRVVGWWTRTQLESQCRGTGPRGSMGPICKLARGELPHVQRQGKRGRAWPNRQAAPRGPGDFWLAEARQE